MKRVVIIALLHCAFIGVLGSTIVQPTSCNNHRATFRQTRYAVALTEPIVQTGLFVYIAPDSVLWQYDGMKAMTLPPAMKSLIRLAVQGDTTAMMQAFDVQRQGNTLTLIPKKKQLQRLFTSLQMTLDKQGAAKQVILNEPNGDRTEIEFFNR